MMADLWLAHLSFALLAFALTPGFGLGPVWQVARLLALLAISMIPVAGLSLAEYMHSFTGDAAITSLVALAYLAAVRIGLAPRLRQGAAMQIMVIMAVLALFLYPATMGLSYFDPYRLGYQPRDLIIAIGILAFALLALRNTLGVCMFAAATLAFCVGFKSSPNYWDYLIDPFIALYSCGVVIRYTFSRAWRTGISKPDAVLSAQP